MTSVDPTAIPAKLSGSQLEWFILFSICVAGKGAKQTEAKVNALLKDSTLFGLWYTPSPFERIRYAIGRGHGELLRLLKRHKIGQYTRINKAFREVVKLDVANLTVAALEAVPGIGPKTARFIILYSEPDSNVVPLDTHILKFLRAEGYDAPKSTPPAGKKYEALEKAFQLEAAKRFLTVRELDTEVWTSYARV